MTVLTATDATFDELVLQSELPVLVDFTAEWCPPCRAMPPILEAIATEEADRLRVVTVDVDDNPATAMTYRVTGMPTFLLVKNGVVLRSMTAAKPKPALLAAIADLI